jgi:hypothetical protein
VTAVGAILGIFAAWQPRYAAHGIATIPVDAERKAPAVKQPERFGIRGSTELAHRFPEADAIGFIAGKLNRITALDIDTASEGVLADALNHHGHSPFIVRTASGKFHAYYRHNGERRRIRPFPGLPIDIIGAGLLIAAPTIAERGTYEVIQGKFDDLDCLPPMRNALSDAVRTQFLEGKRNNKLWAHCMCQAHHCDSFDALLDVARTQNDQANMPPLNDAKVVKITQSAWRYTEKGTNRFGQHGVWFTTQEANALITTDPDQFLLLAYLRANNGPDGTFMVANGLASVMPLPRKRLAAARHRLEQTQLEMVRPASKYTGPALYRWKSKGGQF